MKWPYGFTSELRTIYTVAKDNSAITYEGVLEIAVEHLKEKGYTLNIVDDRPALEPADKSNIGELRELQPEALDVVIKNRMGIIECPPGFGKTYLIVQMVKMYPTLRIAIVTTRAAVLEEIYSRIKENVPKPAEVHMVSGGKGFKPSCRVAVITSKSLHKLPSNWPDIFIYDECHGCASDIQLPLISRIECRKYGLSASPDGRPDGCDLEIIAMLGPIRYTVSYQQAENLDLVCPIEARIVAVKTVMPWSSWPMDKQRNVSDTKRARYGYWRNDVRNQTIARAANKHKEDSIIILVKTLEHALFLRLLLPDFYIAHRGIPNTVEGNEKWAEFCKLGLVTDTKPFIDNIRNIDLTRMKKLFRAGAIKKVIATPAWREGVDFPNLNVLIRADGSGGSIDAIQIVGRLSRVAPGKEKGIVYDFLDDFGDGFLVKSKKRIKHYAEQRWSIKQPWEFI